MASKADLRAPFPYFGGKRAVAGEVWSRFGTVKNYVEPFFGSGAVLLGRVDISGVETVNDKDGYVANFWRAVQRYPNDVAKHAHNPVNENDLHARHSWLVARSDELSSRLEGNPEWCDPLIAGWWVWGMACWIGSGFCSGRGPWRVDNGELKRGGLPDGQGVNRQRPHLGNAGQGVNRQRPHLSNAGQGVKRQLPHLGNAGQGVNRHAHIAGYMNGLSERLRSVRVCSGDWSRVCGPSVTHKHGMTAVFLDPPYADTAKRDPYLYRVDSLSLAHEVRKWAIDAGERSDMRIALCGYEGEHEMPATWSVCRWNARGGYGSQALNRSGNERRERIWFSPACVQPSALLAAK